VLEFASPQVLASWPKNYFYQRKILIFPTVIINCDLMKRIKQIAVALLLMLSLAALTTGCTHGRVCQANKIGNHR
jgi:hypothetical protein